MPPRQDPKIRSRQSQRLNIILMISGVVLILAALLMMPFFRQLFSTSADFIDPPHVPRPNPQGNAMGDPNAPVIIQEFSDFGCSHCRTFAFSRAEKIAADYVAKGQVYFVFNSVGSMLGHPNSVVAAQAAYCAGDQGYFWEYHDYLFANQTVLFANINQDISSYLVAFARALALDLARFQTCMRQDASLERVQADQVEAFQAGIVETPSLTINGELFQGDWTLGELETAIESVLSATTP
jgi:protein-disulfide isomerase